MTSINIGPPVSTPADDWAAETTNALHGTTTDSSPISGSSTPGAEPPGAFPGESQTRTQSKLPAEERTPHSAAVRLAEAAPPKSASELQEHAKGYLPNVNVRYVLDTAKAYLPESVCSVLPSSKRDGNQVEKNIEPTSDAKPVSAEWGENSSSGDVDNTSMAVLPPSTRTSSVSSGLTKDARTPPVIGLENALGTNKSDPASSHIPITPTQTSHAPLPGTSSETTPTPVNAATSAGVTHTLSSPPGSRDSPTIGSQSGGQETQSSGLGLDSPSLTNTSRTNNGKDIIEESFPAAKSGSRFSESDGSPLRNESKKRTGSGPTPPTKDESPSRIGDGFVDSQPKVNATPAQGHVKSGTAIGAYLPGTAPAGGDSDAPRPSISPESEISNLRIREDEGKDPKRGENVEGANKGTTVNSSSESLDRNEKKEGRVKKVVHKVKVKLSHRSH